MQVPDKALEVKAAVTAAIAFGTALFGYTGWAVIIWLIVVVLDFLTGTWAAQHRGDWSSKKAREGLWHKLGEIVAVCVAALSDIALSIIIKSSGISFPFDYTTLITPVVLLWYIFTELGSIIENAALLGAPVPEFLKNRLAAVKETAEGNTNEE